MKNRILYAILIVAISLFSFLAGIFYKNNIPNPSQNVYWHDDTLNIFRELPKGFLDKSNKNTFWFTQSDLAKIKLESEYKEFLSNVKRMETARQYQMEKNK